MASTIEEYDQARQLIREFASGAFSLKLALVDSNYVFDQTDTLFSDASGDEVSGTGYTAGGEAVTGLTVLADGTIDADNVEWTTLTATYRRGILYIVGTVDGKVNPLLFSYLYDDTPADIVVVASNATHVWSGDGVVS